MIFATFVGKGVRDQPGLRALQGAAGVVLDQSFWEPTRPLERAAEARRADTRAGSTFAETGGARTSAGYSVKEARPLWLTLR